MPQSARVEGESETVASLPPSGREGDRSGVPRSEFTSFGGSRVSGGRRKRKKEPVVAVATTGSFCFGVWCLTKFCGLQNLPPRCLKEITKYFRGFPSGQMPRGGEVQERAGL